MDQTLVQLCLAHLAHTLLTSPAPPDLASIPEPELAHQLWQECQRLAGSGRYVGVPPINSTLRILAAFTPFWQLARLELVLRPPPRAPAAPQWPPAVALRLPPHPVYQSPNHLLQPRGAPHGTRTPLQPPPHRRSGVPPEQRAAPEAGCRPARLALVGAHLVHLELSSPLIADLSWLPGVPHVRCLSLRGCTGLPPGALGGLASLGNLGALDVRGLQQLDDSAAPALARLPALLALDLGNTGVGDATVEALTYGARAAAWAAAAGKPLPAEAASCAPATALRRLHLCGTRATSACLESLLALRALEFLDLRWTGVRRGELRPLEKRFGLQSVQGAVLARSVTLASALVSYEAPACCCAGPPGKGAPQWQAQWAHEGIAALLTCANQPSPPPAPAPPPAPHQPAVSLPTTLLPAPGQPGPASTACTARPAHLRTWPQPPPAAATPLLTSSVPQPAFSAALPSGQFAPPNAQPWLLLPAAPCFPLATAPAPSSQPCRQTVPPAPRMQPATAPAPGAPALAGNGCVSLPTPGSPGWSGWQQLPPPEPLLAAMRLQPDW